MAAPAAVAPSHAESTPAIPAKIRLAYHVPWAADSKASLEQNIGALDYVSPYWYHMGGWGELVDADGVTEANRAQLLQLAQSRNVKVLPLIQNMARNGDFSQVLQDPYWRGVAIQNVVQMTTSMPVAGVHIDFEGMLAEDRPYLPQFMTELAAELHPKGKLVTQAIAARDRERTTGWAGPYDYAALGQVNDLVVLMTYGYGTAVPQSTAPYPWVAASAGYAASQIPPEKLLLGLAFYGYDWEVGTRRVAALTYQRALERARAAGVNIEYDENVHSAWFTYQSGGSDHEVWLEDARAAAFKAQLVYQKGRAGAAAWRMGQEDPQVWNLFRDRFVAPPFAPQLLSPASGTNLTTLGTTINWSGVASATQYHLQIVPFQGDGPAINLIRGPQTSFTAPAPLLGQGPYVMLPGMTYTWRVRASNSTVSLDENNTQWGPWSAGSSFRTRPPVVGGITAVTPPDGGTIAPANPVLRWANQDVEIFYYEVQLSADSRFGESGPRVPVATELRHGALSTPVNSYAIPASFPLERGARYFWRVRPRVQGDGAPAAWSPVFSFTAPR